MVLRTSIQNNHIERSMIHSDSSEDPALQDSAVSEKEAAASTPQQQRRSCLKRARSGQQSSTTTTDKPTTQRSVRFVPLADVFYRHSQQPQVSFTEVWYTPSEFKNFKLRYKCDAKLASSAKPPSRKSKNHSKNNDSNCCVIQQMFECCASAKKKNATTTSLDDPLTQALQQHFQDAPEVIGLERLQSMQVYKDKKWRRQRLWDKVLNVQDSFDRCSFSSSSSSSTSSSSREQEYLNHQAEFLRRACQEISAPSTLFAHHIARCAGMTPTTN